MSERLGGVAARAELDAEARLARGIRSPAPGGDGPGPAAGTAHRSRGGLPLAIVLPGLPQLLAGRIAAGGYALGLWTGLLVLAVWRSDRLGAALRGGVDDRLALLTLVVGLAGAWLWSVRDVRRTPASTAASHSRWSGALASFRRNRVAVAAVIAVTLFYLVALLAPLLAPFDPAAQGSLLEARLASPSPAHWLGTDHFARDVLSRLLYGARVSLGIGLVAVTIAVTIGTLLGAVSGYLGGAVDTIIMRGVDMVISFPRLVLLIAIIALFQPSLLLIMVVLGLTQWPQVTRIVRAEVLSLREREFIEAGRALGFSTPRIVFRHVVPNVLGPVIVAASLGIGDTIVLEAGLSFLGIGVQPPTPSWGTMVADGRNHLLGAWWIATLPGLAIVTVVLSFNLAGDGLRDALDPRETR